MSIMLITTCYNVALSVLGMPANTCYTEEFVVTSFAECEIERPGLTNDLQTATNTIMKLTGQQVSLPKVICQPEQ